MRRDKSNAACYVGPLPDDLPKPADLRSDLQMVRILLKSSWTNLIVKRELHQCGLCMLLRFLSPVHSIDIIT